jgi:ATP-binding cassette subfamily B protein AbcA/BmrA
MIIIDRIDLSNISFGLLSILFLVLLLSLFISVITTLSIINVAEIILRNIRKALCEKILYLPITFFDETNTGEIMSRITNDTIVLKDFIASQATSFISSIITVIGSVILLIIIDWKIAILLSVSIPIAVITVILIGNREYKISRQLQDAYADWQSNLHRIISDIRLLKSAAAEKIEQENEFSKIDELKKLSIQEGKVMAFIEPISSTIIMLLLIVIVGYGGLRVSEGTLTTGGFVATLSYLFRLTSPFSDIMNFFTHYQKFLGSFEHISTILTSENEVISYSCKSDDSNHKNALCFSDVNFYYDSNVPILKSINFEAKEGEVTAIVGPSGAGKTTIFSLIERFYQASNGYICYENNNISNYDLYEWRNKIAYVFQDSPMMYGTILSNLAYGLNDYTQEMIDDALEKSSLTSFISLLPQGLNTDVGEKGIKLSGGERQRLAIARAMIRNPQILLLDEATSHLDSESERLVQNSLEKLMHGRTTIVIAHRLSTVINADKIIVLENGRITGTGTHNELMKENHLYKKFVKQQLTP